jgi:hypothetical protein
MVGKGRDRALGKIISTESPQFVLVKEKTCCRRGSEEPDQSLVTGSVFTTMFGPLILEEKNLMC